MAEFEVSWCDKFCKEALDEITSKTALSSFLFPDEIEDVIKAIDGALHSAWYNGYEHGELDSVC
jgi:hypothetical protein